MPDIGHPFVRVTVTTVVSRFICRPLHGQMMCFLVGSNPIRTGCSLARSLQLAPLPCDSWSSDVKRGEGKRGGATAKCVFPFCRSAIFVPPSLLPQSSQSGKRCDPRQSRGSRRRRQMIDWTVSPSMETPPTTDDTTRRHNTRCGRGRYMNFLVELGLSLVRGKRFTQPYFYAATKNESAR